VRHASASRAGILARRRPPGRAIVNAGGSFEVHELGLAMDIYQTCRQTVAGHGGGKLDFVRVAVGELAAVEPDLLAFAWEAVTADGPDEGSRLDVEWRPARQHCPACGGDVERSRGSWLRVCPHCEGILAVEGGEVLEVGFTPDDDGGESDGDG
jgi:Zn finger protein HypA/HybF involved in hydrogenase expression